jgi:heme/copper-type cytochrome/quinol oxidase subunit 3
VTEFAVTRREPSLAWWGMALFVAAETTLFGVLVATYFYLRFKNVEWPPHGIPEPRLVVPLALLGVLVLTSVPMQLALRAVHARRLGAARLLLVLALVVQAGYFAMQVHEYAADLGRFAPSDYAYGSIYYTLLGADHAHVALGLLLDLWLLGKLARGLTRYRLNAFSAITLYWHAVNVITIAVTLTTLSPAL